MCRVQNLCPGCQWEIDCLSFIYVLSIVFVAGRTVGLYLRDSSVRVWAGSVHCWGKPCTWWNGEVRLSPTVCRTVVQSCVEVPNFWLYASLLLDTGRTLCYCNVLRTLIAHQIQFHQCAILCDYKNHYTYSIAHRNIYIYNKYIYIYIWSYILTYIHKCRHTYLHTHIHIYSYTYIHTYIYNIYNYIHTHTDHWGDLGVDGWIILGWISRRWDVGIWTGLGWPRIGTGGGCVWVR